MDSFVWDHNYAIGQEEIDGQHKHLISVINRLGTLLAEQGAFSSAEIGVVFNELAAYTQHHFREEEDLMIRMGVDIRHLQLQVEAHNQFLREINRFREMVDPNDTATAKPLLGFLTHWLVYHMLGADKSMGRQVEAIQRGVSPEQAFHTEPHPLNEATIPLVKSFNELFDQLCSRNRALQELNKTLEWKVEERTAALLEANSELTRMVHRLEAEMQESRRLSEELAKANRDLTHIAQTDMLTGLPNRRYAMNCLAMLWERDAYDDAPLSCILIDADGFKGINDHFGHDAGDEVLREIALQLSDSVRTDDIVCRLGGDEFLIICPATPLAGALHIAEKVREDVSTLRVKIADEEWIGSISAGVTTREAGMLRYDELIKAADRALYAAKRLGRNRVSCGT